MLPGVYHSDGYYSLTIRLPVSTYRFLLGIPDIDKAATPGDLYFKTIVACLGVF